MPDSNMIIDELKTAKKYSPELTGNEGITIKRIKKSITDAIIPFKKSLGQHGIRADLDENELTQIFVHRVDYQINQLCQDISVSVQYYNALLKTEGVPDFYFYKREEAKEHEALFVVESKRLPSPSKTTSEYVIGGKNNGGIERFKTEKHGKGLSQCGMLGFIEKETFLYWLRKINLCIENITKTNNSWKIDEILNMFEQNNDYCLLKSIVHRKLGDKDINLQHWWVLMKNKNK
jgi:hypothetical protein